MANWWRTAVRRYWAEALWTLWVAVNAAAAIVVPSWATVPFHFIWIGLALMYGWRVWGMRATWIWLGVVAVVTGIALGGDVVGGDQPFDELTEIPLMSVVFLVMVWYVRRHVQAREQTRIVSERNMHLIEQQRRLIQDASHVLRTPLTIAMGHAELVLRDPAGSTVTDDLEVVVGQLRRLKTISDRLIALAGSERPDFLRTEEVWVSDLVSQAEARWFPTTSRLRVGAVADEMVCVDGARIADAIDELISNAINHAPVSGLVTLSARRDQGWVILAVADEGPGVPPDDRERIFERFGRSSKLDDHNGLGLGLALVRAIAEAHGGTVSVQAADCGGAVFEIRLPVASSDTVADATSSVTGVVEPARLSPEAGW